MRKLNARKYIRNINDNVVQGRLSENYLTRNTKYFRYEIFTIYGMKNLATLESMAYPSLGYIGAAAIKHP